MYNNVLEYSREILMSIVPKNYYTYTLFTASLTNTVFLSPLLSPLSGFRDYEGYVIQKNGIRKRCSKKRVCRIMFCNIHIKY